MGKQGGVLVTLQGFLSEHLVTWCLWSADGRGLSRALLEARFGREMPKLRPQVATSEQVGLRGWWNPSQGRMAPSHLRHLLGEREEKTGLRREPSREEPGGL